MRPLRRSLGGAAAVVAVASLAGGLAACGNEDRPASSPVGGAAPASGSHAGPGRNAPFSREQADSVVPVTLRDFGFRGIEPVVKGPKVFFEASNDGPAEHELVVVDEDGRKLGAIAPFKRGTGVRTLPLELGPGRYQARCTVRLGPRTHAQLGMEAVFTVE